MIRARKELLMKKIIAAVLLLLPMLCGCTLLDGYMEYRLEEEIAYHASGYPVQDCTRLTSDGSGISVNNTRKLDTFREKYGMGTCHTLSGSAEDVADFTEMRIFPALDFLKREAAAWGVELDFDIKRFSVPLSGGLRIKYTGVINRDLEVGGTTKDIPHQMASRLGCDSPLELLAALREEFQTEYIIPVMLVQANGLSYTRNQYSEGIKDHMEHSVIFSDTWNSTTGQWRYTGKRSAAVAHHILCLFGAENFYSFDTREAIAEEYYPLDIMLMDYTSLYLLEVGDFTAYCVGWTDKMPAVCRRASWYAP